MKPRRIIVTERKEKNRHAQFVTLIFFPFIVISGRDPPRHSEWGSKPPLGPSSLDECLISDNIKHGAVSASK